MSAYRSQLPCGLVIYPGDVIKIKEMEHACAWVAQGNIQVANNGDNEISYRMKAVIRQNLAACGAKGTLAPGQNKMITVMVNDLSSLPDQSIHFRVIEHAPGAQEELAVLKCKLVPKDEATVSIRIPSDINSFAIDQAQTSAMKEMSTAHFPSPSLVKEPIEPNTPSLVLTKMSVAMNTENDTTVTENDTFTLIKDRSKPTITSDIEQVYSTEQNELALTKRPSAGDWLSQTIENSGVQSAIISSVPDADNLIREAASQVFLYMSQLIKQPGFLESIRPEDESTAEAIDLSIFGNDSLLHKMILREMEKKISLMSQDSGFRPAGL